MALKPVRRLVGLTKTSAVKPKPKLGLAGKPVKPPGGFGGAAPKHKVSSGGAFSKATREFALYEERRNQPFRKSVPVGGESEVYFLDKTEPFVRYEHNIGGGPNSRGTIVPCIKDGPENCPACAKESKEGAFVMFLTCVTPVEKYKGKDGKERVIRWRKQPFPIKVKMARKYQRLYEQHGTFRGMVVKLNRDNKMDAATGSDVTFVRMMPESEIQKWARELPGITDKEMRDAVIKSDITTAFDYEKMFPRPDAKKLAELVGSALNTAGNADFVGEDDDEDYEATGWGE